VAAQRPSVLLVVADPVAGEALSFAFDHEGYEVREAADGRAALAAIEHRVPGCMVLDLALPAAGGLAVLEALHDDARVRDMRIVALTDGDDSRSLYRCFQLGVFKHLPKPVGPELAVRCVGALLGMGYQEARRRRRAELDRARRQVAELEASTRRHFSRLLQLAGWHPSEIAASHDPGTGRMQYRLSDLCLLKAVGGDEPFPPPGDDGVAFVMASDGRHHRLWDRRTAHQARLFAVPTRSELVALRDHPDALVDGFVAAGPGGLRPHQRHAAHQAARRLLGGEPAALVQMAAGSGKAATAAAVLAAMDRAGQERHGRPLAALYLVADDLLEHQAVALLARHLAEQGAGHLRVGVAERAAGAEADVVVAVLANLGRPGREGRANGARRPPPARLDRRSFDLVVADDVLGPGGEIPAALAALTCPKLALCTAAPVPGGAGEPFGAPVSTYSDEQAVADGVVAPCVIHRVTSSVGGGGGGGAGAIEGPGEAAVAEYYRDNFAGRGCLVFAPDAASANSLAERFSLVLAARGEGQRAAAVVRTQGRAADRRRLVEEFKKPGSSLSVLVGVNLLAGLDHPGLDLVVLCRATTHEALYRRMKGTGAGLVPGKDHFVLVDFAGASSWEEGTAPSPMDDRSLRADQDLATDPPGLPCPEQGEIPEPGEGPMGSHDQDGAGFETHSPPVGSGTGNGNGTGIGACSGGGGIGAPVTTVEVVGPHRPHGGTDAGMAALQAELAREHELLHATRREAFGQLVAGLHHFAPSASITEDILGPAGSWARDLATLNQAYGVQRPSVQAHIDAVLEAAAPAATP